MFKDILIALKFSPAGLHAFKTALQLSRSNDAQLHVFHALDYRLKNRDQDDPKLNEALKLVDDQIKTNLFPHLLEKEKKFIHYLPADPALEACRMARKIPADLIVVGCHHTHRELSMGRVDYVGMTILEKAPCAVMLIPLDEHESGGVHAHIT
jgi:nucleotide-binding universal stress UspA family protein